MELYDCPKQLIVSPEAIEKIMVAAATLAGASIVESNFHQFNPHGVSGVVIIKESHLTIHTWPEFNYAAVDLFTCGNIDTQAAIDHLKLSFKAKKTSVQLINRGPLQ